MLPPSALAQPLFVDSIDGLRRKLNSGGGLLAEYWRDFRKRIMADPGQRRNMLFLPVLLTGEGIDEAGDVLREYWQALRQSDAAGDVQFHTWCRGGSVTRRVAFFDWLAHRAHWSAADIEDAAEAFLGFAFKHSYAVLTVRTRTSNNQALSMALNCAITGFVFGHKLAQHPAAKFLFDYGMSRMPDLIGLFPGDGYGGEGSTYTSHVNTPLAYWLAEFLRQLGCPELVDQPFAPNQTTLRKIIQAEMRLLSPGGLLAPWDHYGWQSEINASPFAYLARLEGDPRYLSLIAAFDLWSDPGMLAWGHDDPLWTLLWWPDAANDHDDRSLPGDLFGWFLPKTGAALDDAGRRTRLLHVWDANAETVAAVGRAQCNPNHVVFEIDGEPVFQDGVPANGPDPWHYPVEAVFSCLDAAQRRRFFHYRGSIGDASIAAAEVAAGIVPGLIGSANCIVVDGESWYWPGSRRVGQPEFYNTSGRLQAVTTDATSFYTPRYDVTRARRTSVWTAAGFGLILDTLEADSDHTWQWQAYLRPEVNMGDLGCSIALPGRRDVLMTWEAGCEVRTTDVQGFPRTHEERCTRLELHRRGPRAEFAVVIAPGARSASVVRDGNRVRVTVDGRTHYLVVENTEGRPETIGPGETSAAFAWWSGEGVAELASSMPVDLVPDQHHLEDMTVDFDRQVRQIEELVQWDCSAGDVPDGDWLARTDWCLAQLKSDVPDSLRLLTLLHCGDWAVRVAAADVLGRLGDQSVAPALREALADEHAIPESVLYPSGEQDGPDAGKRWRLKAALIAALGRLRDRQTVPVLGQILADGRDFYGVYSVAVQALGRIGGPDALAALSPALDDVEDNTATRTRYVDEKLRSWEEAADN